MTASVYWSELFSGGQHRLGNPNFGDRRVTGLNASVRVGAVAYQSIQRGALALADLFFAPQRVLQATPERALGFRIQLAEQAGP